MDLATVASTNMQRHLYENVYPGRGIIVGRSTADDAWLQVYWIMGRSDNSRNRKFVIDGTSMRTEAVDEDRLVDPTNVIYEAMLELPDVAIVTNGDQTRTIAETIDNGGTFEDALATREREDDAPNFTPRISAMLDRRGQSHGISPSLMLSILRANEADFLLTDRIIFNPALPPPGFGFGLTTYQADGDPLPSFCGDPLWFPLKGEVSDVLSDYWAALNSINRVAIAVKWIPDEHIPSVIDVVNRYDSI